MPSKASFYIVRAETSSEYRKGVTQCEESDPDHLKVPTELAASKSHRGWNAGHQDLDVQPRSSYLPEDKRSCCIHTLKLWISTLTHKCDIPTFTVVKADGQNQGSGTTAHSLRAVHACSLTCITNTLNNIWRT